MTSRFNNCETHFNNLVIPFFLKYAILYPAQIDKLSTDNKYLGGEWAL